MQNLNRFGHEFQVKLITCLLTDSQFSSRIFDILKPEYFDSRALNWLCDVILKYYAEYHAVATMPVLKVEIDSVEDQLLKEEIISALREAVTSEYETDLQFIKESTIEFCRNQELQYAIYDSVDLLKEGKFEEIKQRIDEALKRGEDREIGHDYLHDIDDRYITMTRKPIPTGWGFINELTQGGLSAGELGVFVGNSGSGKSWCLMHACANALDAGYKCLYVTLELLKTVAGTRIDCMLTGISMPDLPDNLEAIRNRLRRIEQKGGELYIEWYPTKKLSIIGLRSLLDRMTLLGHKPDIVFIDYADLMRLPNTKARQRKDEDLQELYEELRGIAGEYMVPVWTASQANRDSHDDEIEFVSAGMISESMGKHFTADFMMSLLRKESDKVTHTARFHVIKNRMGDDGMTLLAKMNLREGIIDIFHPKSNGHREAEDRIIDEQTNVKSRMKDKLKNFFSDTEDGK